MSNPLEETAGELVDLVRTLNESISRASDVRDELDNLVKRSKTNRKMMIVVIIGFALDVFLTVAMVFVTAQVARNANRIDRVVQVQQNGALCPLYRIFIESDTQTNRDRAAAQGQDMAERARQYAIIRQSYAALNCQQK